MKDTSAAFAGLLGSIGFWLGWLAIPTLKVPQLWYFPVERTFAFGVQPPGMVMGLFGQLLFALLLGGIFGIAAWAISQRREISRGVLRATVGVSVVLFCGVAAYYAHAMWGRVPY